MKALRILDVPVLLSVWVLCVTTDWSTGTKAGLNIAAVALLCLKEFMVHRALTRSSVSRTQPASSRAKEFAFA